MVDTQAPYAATQDAIAAAQAREAAGAAQAAAINAAYMANTLPVLPKYAAGGGATYTAAELADAAAEQAKHEAAFHPPEINYAAYANVPLSQMPANVASRVQEYYTQNPSARAQAITQQYAAQHQIAENPFAPDTAAGIAWEVARTTGGAGNITESMRKTAGIESRATYGVDVFAGIPTVSGISTVPTRDLTSGMLSGSKMVAALPSGTTTTYMPYGEFAQIEMKGSKLLIDERTGELGVYQQPFGHSQFMLTGGGGRAALQSGMFTVEKAETPYVVEQGKVGSYILPSGKGLSRLGAEGYGGLVRPLDERRLEPNEAISRYAGTTGKYNLANLVSQIPAGKAEVPGAKIPWSISEESPAIQYMDKGGIVPGSAITVPSGGRLVGGKTVASVATVAETGEGVLPLQFKSTTAPSAATVAAQNEYQPSGFLGLGGLLPAMPSYEKTKAYSVDVMSRMVAAGPIGGLGIIAKEEFGAPISTIAGVTSRLSFGASEIIFKPTPITVPGETKETTKTEAFQLPITRTTEITNLPKSTTISGGNKTISDLGDWLTGSRGSIDRTNLTAVKEYNTKSDLFTKMQEQNPVFVTTTGGTKATTTETGDTRTVTTTTGESASKVYASEWDRFVEGSGRVARYVLGTPMAKQEAYFETIKGEQGIVGEAKRGLYFVGTTITNKPAELAPAAVLGFGIRQAAAMAPGFLGEVAAGSGVTAKAAQFLQTPGGVSLAKAGMLAGFGGAYVYDVTDKLTATAEKTKENIYRSAPALAAMYAGGGGVDWVGETSVVRGASAPSGATFSGVKIQDTYFGGGRTPTGQRYAGAFSPTESYVLSGKTTPPTGPATVPTPTGQLKLPSGSGGYGAETYPSSFEGPVRDYSKMDLSGGARPFSIKTAPEMQAASTAKFRDTSGAAQPFVIKTQAEAAARPAAEPVVSQLVGDFSGKAHPFTMKTAAEVKAGYWDVAEPIPRGDISGRGSKISLTTEREYLSGLPRDVSGKGEPFASRTQEEILSTWERERAATEQGAANIQWVKDVVGGKGIPKTKVSTKVEEPELIGSIFDSKTGVTSPVFKTPTQRQTQPQVSTKVEVPQKQYAEPRTPFGIPGVSEAAISAELAGMHPVLREQALGISKVRAPSTLLEREYPYTQIEREGIGRMGEEKRAAIGFPIPKRARKAIPKPGASTKVGESKRQKVVVSPTGGIIPETTIPPTKRTPSALPTKITTPKEPPTVTTKKTVEVVPYKTTTPRETQKTTTTTQPQEFPWTRITEQPSPTKTITKLPPAVITPLFPGLPSFGGGGGAGGGCKKGSRAYVEVLGFETSRGRKGAWTFGKRKAKK